MKLRWSLTLIAIGLAGFLVALLYPKRDETSPLKTRAVADPGPRGVPSMPRMVDKAAQRVRLKVTEMVMRESLTLREAALIIRVLEDQNSEKPIPIKDAAGQAMLYRVGRELVDLSRRMSPNQGSSEEVVSRLEAQLEKELSIGLKKPTTSID